MSQTKKLAIVYACLQLLSIAFVLGTAQNFPMVVASHFDLAGQANATMPREQFILVYLALMVLLPGLMVLLPRILAKLPHQFINIPHRSFWLASEKIDETLKVFQKYFLVLASLLSCFLAVMYWLVMQAHLQSPPQVSTKYLLVATAVFVLLTLYGSFRLNLKFRKLPEADVHK